MDTALITFMMYVQSFASSGLMFGTFLPQPNTRNVSWDVHPIGCDRGEMHGGRKQCQEEKGSHREGD